MLKVWRPGRKTSGFWTIRILKICQTSGPDVMSGRVLADPCYKMEHEETPEQIFVRTPVLDKLLFMKKAGTHISINVLFT